MILNGSWNTNATWYGALIRDWTSQVACQLSTAGWGLCVRWRGPSRISPASIWLKIMHSKFASMLGHGGYAMRCFPARLKRPYMIRNGRFDVETLCRIIRISLHLAKQGLEIQKCDEKPRNELTNHYRGRFDVQHQQETKRVFRQKAVNGGSTDNVWLHQVRFRYHKVVIFVKWSLLFLTDCTENPSNLSMSKPHLPGAITMHVQQKNVCVYFSARSDG